MNFLGLCFVLIRGIKNNSDDFRIKRNLELLKLLLILLHCYIKVVFVAACMR